MDADALSVARCTLKGSTFAFYVHMGSSFDDVVREIQSLFADVDLSGFILKYSVNGSAKCNLTTDRDVQMMLVSKRVARSDFIDIEVVDTSSNSVVTENEQISDLVIDDCDPISNTDHALLGDKGCEQIVSMTDVWKTYITKVKQVFYGGTKEFRQQLTKYTIALGFKIKFIKNDKKRVTAVCAKRVSNGCPWRIHGSIQKVNSNFYIKTFNNTHTCGGIVTTRRSAMVNSRLVALTITNMIRENPLYRPTDIMLDMKSRYGLDVSYWNAWYGRELARKELHGNENESYEQLVVYLSSVLDTNPGSHCRIEFDKETNRFTRCFVAFGACIKGFQKCRPLLCLDGTHLKSKHKGTLLVATGKNGDQGLYPLAFAVVDGESDENWRWFMEHLHHILESDDRTITFIFDCNNGLINAIKEWFPEHPHAYCYHHLTVNIQSKFPGSTNKDTRDKVLTLFTTCAYTYSKKRFNKALEELKKEGGEVIKKFLRTLSFKNWANSYFPGERYGEMCSNIVESFNSMVLDERTLPITQLIDGIRSRLMRFIGDRSHDASKWTSVLCPKFEKLLNAHVKAGEHWIVNRSSAGVYEVLADYTCKVDLFARTCTCPKWRLLGFPCVHAVTVIKFLDVDPYNYVEDYFKVDTFRECYSNSILPIIQHVDDMPNDEDVPLLLPPKTKTQPGRPRSNRFKSTGEVGKIKCGRCGQLCGHNRRTCSENI